MNSKTFLLLKVINTRIKRNQHGYPLIQKKSFIKHELGQKESTLEAQNWEKVNFWKSIAILKKYHHFEKVSPFWKSIAIFYISKKLSSDQVKLR